MAGCSGSGDSRQDRTPADPSPEERAHPGGQTPPGPPPMAFNPIGKEPLPPAPRAAVNRDPVLMPGDSLSISVYDEPDLQLEVRVPENGAFTYPLIGSVEAAGLTPGGLETCIRERLAKGYIRNPQVTVTVTAFAPRQVYILGGVAKPSGYVLPPSERLTLLQLISVAGGITDRAYKEFVQIVRTGPKGEREVVQVSLVEIENAIAQGRGEADVPLQPDDLVVIPSAARVVYVLGAVKSPGWFEIPADTQMTASMAISRAGSYTMFASTSSIQILRREPGGGAKKIAVNLDDIVGGKLDADAVLQPGDVVWVPERGLF
ncbi:MAG: polysaccharide biosynthesis/export family protein [Planctomycetia bacterium]|nr:polysaccharide biosynthesis/export family protein [Planctomycetia bacterium]